MRVAQRGLFDLSWNRGYEANEDIYGFDNTFFDISNDEAQLGARLT